MVRGLFLLLLAVLSPMSFAEQTKVEESVLEKHVYKLTEELRCLVCQNQTIADSHSGLAIDLRNEVREKIQRGDSDEEIKAFMVDRYGDFVLYRPPVKSTTWLLWFGPFFLVLIGLVILYVQVKSSRVKQGIVNSNLSNDERVLIDQILGNQSVQSEQESFSNIDLQEDQKDERGVSK